MIANSEIGMNIDEYVKYVYEKSFSIQGKSLFRYRSGIYEDGTCYSVEALKNNEMWFSAANTMDDIFDCKINLPDDYMQNLKNKLRQAWQMPANVQLNNENFDFLLNECANERISQITYLACFSETCDSSIMWHYYASEHKGFCIEYDYDSIYKCVDYTQKNKKDGQFFLAPVVYNNRNTIEGLNIGHSSIIKRCEWGFEDEWRIININPNTKEKYISVEIELKPIAVYLGYYVSSDDRLYSELKLYCKENNIKLKKPQIINDNFSFKFDDIDLDN